MSETRSAEVIGLEEASLEANEPIVLLLWHLGDVLNATALLPDLARRHGRRITFATVTACVPLVRHHPDVARVLVVDRRLPEEMTLAMWAELEQLHERLFPRHETVYNLHRAVDLKRWNHHIIELWSRIVGREGSYHDLSPRFHPDPVLEPLEREWEYVVIGNGGSSYRKCWPDARWRKLVSWLKRKHPGLHRVQIGGPDDRSVDGVEHLQGTTSIDESYWLLKRARACVTNDSFLAHLSAAAGCDTLTIFGPSAPRQFHPLGPGARVSLGGHYYRTPCSRNLCRLGIGRVPCLAFPSAMRVTAALDRMLCVAANPSWSERAA